MSNILSMPMVRLTVETGNNEDWIDSLKYVVGTGPSPPQLDLTGITFQMEIRRQPEDHEVIISASTSAGTIKIGASPDYGSLVIDIPDEIMKTKKAGVYVGDMVANDDLYTRVVMQIDLTIVEGLTKLPVFVETP